MVRDKLKGLKILWSESSVRVRPPPPALANFNPLHVALYQRTISVPDGSQYLYYSALIPEGDSKLHLRV